MLTHQINFVPNFPGPSCLAGALNLDGGVGFFAEHDLFFLLNLDYDELGLLPDSDFVVVILQLSKGL